MSELRGRLKETLSILDQQKSHFRQSVEDLRSQLNEATTERDSLLHKRFVILDLKHCIFIWHTYNLNKFYVMHFDYFVVLKIRLFLEKCNVCLFVLVIFFRNEWWCPYFFFNLIYIHLVLHKGKHIIKVTFNIVVPQKSLTWRLRAAECYDIVWSILKNQIISLKYLNSFSAKFWMSKKHTQEN